MNCPVCGSRATGKVGSNQFYCWDCCVEYVPTNDKIQVFGVEEDGSLVDYQEEVMSCVKDF